VEHTTNTNESLTDYLHGLWSETHVSLGQWVMGCIVARESLAQDPTLLTYLVRIVDLSESSSLAP